MPTTKQIRADAARLGIQTIRTVADGRIIHSGRVTCAACQAHEEIVQRPGVLAHVLLTAFEKKGWTGLGKRPLCSLCAAKPSIPNKPAPQMPPKVEEPAMLPKQKITKAAMDQMKWHWWTPDVEKVLEACVRCGQCEADCTQQLPILERFEQLRKDYQEFGS